MKHTRNRNLIYTLLAIFCTIITADAEDISVSSAFNPQTLLPGETGVYSITVEGSKAAPGGTIPQPHGLNMQKQGNSQSFNYINGKTSIKVTYKWAVSSRKHGTYTVPSYNVLIDGVNHTVPAASVTVVSQGMSSPNSSHASGISNLDLRLSLPRDSIYVGESVPISVDFYVERNTEFKNLSSIPMHESEAFSVADFIPNSHKEVSIIENGRRIQKVSFFTVITALKSGEHPLVFNFPVKTVRANQRNQRRRDPFFGGFFDRRQWSQLDLNTDSAPIKILPLPKDGKPADYTDAIGSFTANLLEPTNKTVEIGEPITINFSVSGQGNFNRISAPVINGGDSWKVYDPKSTFEQTDQFGRTGTKTFEYILIPEKEGVLTTPPINFNFFDPAKRKYEIMQLPSIPITVKPSSDKNHSYTPIPAQIQLSDNNKPDTPQAKHLLGIQRELGSWYKDSKPLFTKPWFLLIQLIILILLVTGTIIRKRQMKLQTDIGYARNIKYSKATQLHLKAAKKNSTNDFPSFFENAKDAIRTSIARGATQDAESLTLADIESILSTRDISDESMDSIRYFFNTGDALKYGGSAESELQPQDAITTLETLVSDLNKKK